MPRYGLINERRNQLHEVIRLSGMNLIIDNNDHQLIIKVASIPAARVQIYFIDNEDYFHRKAIVRDENGVLFPDNDERAIFFARGVLETVKKLRWTPDVVHCHVVSLYDDAFEGELDKKFKAKIQGEGVPKKYLDYLDDPTYENLMKFVINYADGVIFETPEPAASIVDFLHEKKKPFLEFQDKTTAEYLDHYQAFYNKILANE